MTTMTSTSPASTITLQQAIETGYGDGTSHRTVADLPVIPVEDLLARDVDPITVGDGLKLFVLSECVWDNLAGTPETQAHWDIAIDRVTRAMADLESVREALEHYRPTA